MPGFGEWGSGVFPKNERKQENVLPKEGRETSKEKEPRSLFERLSRCTDTRGTKVFILLSNLFWLRGGTRDVFVGGLTTLAEESASLTEQGKEIVAEQRKERVDIAFRDVITEIRADGWAREEFGSRSLEIVAEELERFSSDKTFATLSDLSGVPESDLLLDQNLRRIALYSDAALEKQASVSEEFDSWGNVLLREKGGAIDARGTYSAPVLSSKEHAASAAGLCDNRNGVIFLNLSNIISNGKDSLTQEEELKIRETVNDILYHEFMHLFSAESYRTEVERLLYEGTTDALSLRLRMNLGVSARPESEAYSPGYSRGPLYAGEFLIESLGGPTNTISWETYLSGFSGFEEEVDLRYGPGAYQKVISEDVPAVPPEMISEVDLEEYGRTYNARMHIISLHRLSHLVNGFDERTAIFEQMAVDFPDGHKVYDIPFTNGSGVVIGSNIDQDNSQTQLVYGIAVFDQPQDGVSEVLLSNIAGSDARDLSGTDLTVWAQNGRTPIMSGLGVSHDETDENARFNKKYGVVLRAPR